ncbi:outer membrane beta-barrel protein [Sphingomonas sp.]|uniref:outer membrane beta-barrel protein n=1 Tax=Sphingomonas sp. TaxID=28214 RepID=UPI003B00FC58
MRLRAALAGASVFACCSHGASAQSTQPLTSVQTAQFLYNDTSLVQPAIPAGFDRGRNVGVVEKARPDFDPTGIPISSFNLYPRLDAGIGATSNVYLANDDRRGDGFVELTPRARMISDWSRHALQFNGDVDLQRYFSNSPRNQTEWDLGTAGRFDVNDELNFTGQASVGRQFESPYAGSNDATAAVLSNYLTSFLSARGEYQAGQFRGQVAVDRTTLSFSNIDFNDDTGVDQSNRNRHIVRFTGQAEYAFTPSVSVYAQGTYSDIDYTHELAPGVANRDSKGVRLVGGVNFDLASFLRGTVAVGYVRRNYDSPLYKTVSGPSVEGKLEYFPSDLTTVTLRLRRFLEDSGIGANAAYFDSRIGLRVDHELLVNLLLNLEGEYGRIDYRQLASAHRDNFRIVGGAQYLATRRYGLKGNLSYGHQTSSGFAGRNFTEVAGQVGVYVQI